MSKTKTINKQEELVLLNDHKADADRLINKLQGEVIPSIEYLGSVYESLELGPMAEKIFADLINNEGTEVSEIFREKVQKDLELIPSKKLRQIASAGSEDELQEVIEVAKSLNEEHSRYLKYISFDDGTFILLDSTKEEIAESFKEYENKLASQLREKHEAAAVAINEFFVMFKELDPGHTILNQSLTLAFDASSSKSTKVAPFIAREINYQLVAKRAETFEENRRDRAIYEFVYELERFYEREGTGKVYSIINKMKKGKSTDAELANSSEVSIFIAEMDKRETEKQLPEDVNI